MGVSRDEALIAGALNGDEASFSQLVERHDRAVRRVLARRISDPMRREELVHETFCLAFQNLARIVRPERLRGWLTRVAANLANDLYRVRNRATPLDSAVEVEASETAAWVWEEVDALPSPLAAVLVLRYREGHSYAEIARQLDVEVSTVRGRIYQARLALRRRLTERDS